MQRHRRALVTLTPAAAERVRTLMQEGQHRFLRVGVKNGGCAGMEYTMSYADEADRLDERVESGGVEILVAANAVLFLVGSVIDFVTTAVASRFVFRNPNETDACGCGESVTIVPAAADA
jgi:iron-sulfur cluster assembly protein